MPAKRATAIETTLRAKVEEIDIQLGRSREVMVERSPDVADEAQAEAIEDLGVDGVGRLWSLRRDVLRALDRLQDGDLGACEECGEPIAAARLDALPWATLCLDCQTAAESRPADNRHHDDWLDAA